MTGDEGQDVNGVTAIGSSVLQTTSLPTDIVPANLLQRSIPLLDRQDNPDAWLGAHGSGVTCLITHSLVGAPRSLLEKLPNLRLIANFGAGLDRIDLEYARARNVVVTASGEVLANDVADLAIWLMFAALRGNTGADDFVRRGDWMRGPYPLGRSASGRRIGIAGFGRIGKAIAVRAEAHGMEVAYHARRPVVGARQKFDPDLEALAGWADVLVIALPGGEATRHAVDARVLDALGGDGILVNVARGSVVDEAALCAALEEGRIAGAALDVFENEPSMDVRLRAAPRLALSPHIGSATLDARRAMVAHVVENIRAFEQGAPLAGVV